MTDEQQAQIIIGVIKAEAKKIYPQPNDMYNEQKAFEKGAAFAFELVINDIDKAYEQISDLKEQLENAKG